MFKTNIAAKPIITKALNAIYPPQCLSCKTIIGENGNLCPDCWEVIHFISGSKCNICGIPFEYEINEAAICGSCMFKKPSYDCARAVFKYDDASRSLITSFKYSDKIAASDYFAKWIARSASDLIDEADLIVAVPLHRIRLFTRRYNQSSLLANSLAKLTKKPIHHNMLRRTKNTKPQAGMMFKQRILNVRGAFKINAKYADLIKGKNIILIDDVMTTGATIEACAKAIKKAGASKVTALTVARTVKG